jgi:hypothetical protein
MVNLICTVSGTEDYLLIIQNRELRSISGRYTHYYKGYAQRGIDWMH